MRTYNLCFVNCRILGVLLLATTSFFAQSFVEDSYFDLNLDKINNEGFNLEPSFKVFDNPSLGNFKIGINSFVYKEFNEISINRICSNPINSSCLSESENKKNLVLKIIAADSASIEGFTIPLYSGKINATCKNKVALSTLLQNTTKKHRSIYTIFRNNIICLYKRNNVA